MSKEIFLTDGVCSHMLHFELYTHKTCWIQIDFFVNTQGVRIFQESDREMLHISFHMYGMFFSRILYNFVVESSSAVPSYCQFVLS